MSILFYFFVVNDANECISNFISKLPMEYLENDDDDELSASPSAMISEETIKLMEEDDDILPQKKRTFTPSDQSSS